MDFMRLKWFRISLTLPCKGGVIVVIGIEEVKLDFKQSSGFYKLIRDTLRKTLVAESLLVREKAIRRHYGSIIRKEKKDWNGIVENMLLPDQVIWYTYSKRYGNHININLVGLNYMT